MTESKTVMTTHNMTDMDLHVPGLYRVRTFNFNYQNHLQKIMVLAVPGILVTEVWGLQRLQLGRAEDGVRGQQRQLPKPQL